MPTLPVVPPFYGPGTTRALFLPAIAGAGAPTRPEITAGTVLTSIRAYDGWELTREFVESVDWDTDFPGQVAARYSALTPSLTFRAAKDGVDVRATLYEGRAGFIVLMPGGDVTGYFADVFPIVVAGLPKQYSDDSPFGIKVQFAVPLKPRIDVVIPATA